MSQTAQDQRDQHGTCECGCCGPVADPSAVGEESAAEGCRCSCGCAGSSGCSCGCAEAACTCGCATS